MTGSVHSKTSLDMQFDLKSYTVTMPNVIHSIWGHSSVT